MKWNTEEFCVGLSIAFAFVLFLKWWILLVAPICGLLWMLGGQYNTNIRRFGIPTVLTVSLALVTHNWWVLTAWLPAHIILRMGYGIPDATDEGSALGKFYYNTLNIRPDWKADLFTRGTLDFLVGLSFISLAWINIWFYLPALVWITFVPPAVAVKVN